MSNAKNMATSISYSHDINENNNEISNEDKSY